MTMAPAARALSPRLPFHFGSNDATILNPHAPNLSDGALRRNLKIGAPK